MGWNYRKSVNLGGGLRLNFSKSGIGISGGVKGFRISSGPKGTRLHASIPGTGIYYTKTLSGSKNQESARSTALETGNADLSGENEVYRYTHIVANEYTGERRELRARTQMELNELIMVEEERQRVNELRQRALKNAEDKVKQVNLMNQQLAQVKNEYDQIIAKTLEKCDRIDWEEQMIQRIYPSFKFEESVPEIQTSYKLNFFKSLFMNERKFELPDTDSNKIVEYEEKRNRAIAEYLKKKNEFETEKNRINGEVVYLRERFEASDKEAVEKYVSIVLSKSKYPADFESDFYVSYERDKKKLVVSYLFQDIDSFPITEKYTYNQRTGNINETIMNKDAATDFYAKVLYSVGIRTLHEVFESVYTNSIEIVVFNGYIETERGHQCAFALRSSRSDFEKIDLSKELSYVVTKVESKSIRDFTGENEVTPFE